MTLFRAQILDALNFNGRPLMPHPLPPVTHAPARAAPVLPSPPDPPAPRDGAELLSQLKAYGESHDGYLAMLAAMACGYMNAAAEHGRQLSFENDRLRAMLSPEAPPDLGPEQLRIVEDVLATVRDVSSGTKVIRLMRRYSLPDHPGIAAFTLLFTEDDATMNLAHFNICKDLPGAW